MKSIWLFLITIAGFSLSSCSDYDKKKVEGSIYSFFDAIKNEKKEALSTLYPDFNKLYYSTNLSDSIKIEKITYSKRNGLSANIISFNTNSTGKRSQHEITLFLKDVSQGNYYIITDTKGLCNYEDNKYKIASKTGCFNATDTTDLQISKKMVDAEEFIYSYAKSIARYVIESNFKIISVKWHPMYTIDAIKVDGLIKNIGGYDLSSPIYHIICKDKNKNIVADKYGRRISTIRSGRVSSIYEIIDVEKKSAISDVSIELDLDSKELLKTLAEEVELDETAYSQYLKDKNDSN